MAKNVDGKLVSNNSGNTSPSICDQQKVPPLRIVLNTAGNQKGSRESTTTGTAANQQQQQETRRDKLQESTKTDNVLKAGSRVRIKLGVAKQTSKSSNSNELSNKSSTEDAQKLKNTNIDSRQQDNTSNTLFKEELTSNYSHLRRITRRSRQRTVQAVSNEDEESISSMTSTDENQSTNNITSDNNNSQEAASVTTTQTNETSSTTATTTAVNATNSSSSNVDTPRRYKRRKGETSESLSGDHDGTFGFQNYKLPAQNSFELYRNIRKQVDKKLKSLNSIHPKTPYGFRDYMLTKGAYLLDGNKLGNGTNLFMNEDGGLHPIPIGKYHALKHNRVNYSVPNRAKVPLGLPVNSPLYNLFIDQEKERYRMRMKHIKEREKLTLAAEQEIMRVYNQAAMAAANQLEPFSACTMLKHQEIYNYLDSDGYAIQASDDMDQDDVKQEGVRSRRRQHERISPPPTRKNSNTEEKDDTTLETNSKELAKGSSTSALDLPVAIDKPLKDDENSKKLEEVNKEKKVKVDSSSERNLTKETASSDTTSEDDKSESKKENVVEKKETDENIEVSTDSTASKKEACKDEAPKPDNNEDEKAQNLSESEHKNETKRICDDKDDLDSKRIKLEPREELEVIENENCIEAKKMNNDGVSLVAEENDKLAEPNSDRQEKDQTNSSILNDSADIESSTVEGDLGNTSNVESKGQNLSLEQQDSVSQMLERQLADSGHVLTDDDRRAYNKEVFISQLQDTDDKWDKIRSEMLIRHRNEAESLHAVQKLEWEWKTKEIGACDIRTTPIIDTNLVPKLNIYSQDY